MVEEADLVGGDLLDLLNVGLHFRRRPVGTGAALAGAIAFLATRFTKARSRRKLRTSAAKGAFGGLVGAVSGGWPALVRNFIGSSLAGAVLSRIGISGPSRPGGFPKSRHYR